MPIFTNSSSSNNTFTLNYRIRFYKLISNYISQQLHKDPNNCISVKSDLIKIGTNIILDKQIGSKSKWGLIFLSHFISTSYSKKLYFATKIINSSLDNNILEYNILKLLTILNVEKQICPHFPICYGALKCDDFSRNKIDDRINLGKLRNKKLIFIFSELANNNLKNLLKYSNDHKILLNAVVQIMISIMFFNKYAKSYHMDGHSGNFLYHEIKPGGYFHYVINGVDYYIENLGYLWVIWDFGLIVPFSFIRNTSSSDNIGIYHNDISINYDYIKTLSSIKKRNKNSYSIPNIDNIIRNIRIYDFTFDLDKMPDLINKVLQSLQKYSDNSLLTSVSSKSKIINKKPFIF